TGSSTSVEEPPRIALTFDDGPNARYTPILLDGLKKRNIRASFFLIGENIEGNEDILLQMRKDGHLIGNHTWDHVQLDKIPAEKARLEIEKTNNRIYEASGIYPSYVRPPFGAWIKDMELSVTMLPVFWDVDTLDWQSKNIDSILSIAQKQVHDGSIILMHDGYQTSVDAALKIADLFTEKGYVFVTADQLLLT
ncbi:MAG: polysaccharide deacetylase family protein, partial [Blautia sp.]|nr:polysaccharide deacetylase family protein [Blautia sp.]